MTDPRLTLDLYRREARTALACLPPELVEMIVAYISTQLLAVVGEDGIHVYSPWEDVWMHCPIPIHNLWRVGCAAMGACYLRDAEQKCYRLDLSVLQQGRVPILTDAPQISLKDEFVYRHVVDGSEAIIVTGAVRGKQPSEARILSDTSFKFVHSMPLRCPTYHVTWHTTTAGVKNLVLGLALMLSRKRVGYAQHMGSIACWDGQDVKTDIYPCFPPDVHDGYGIGFYSINGALWALVIPSSSVVYPTQAIPGTHRLFECHDRWTERRSVTMPLTYSAVV